MRRIRRWLALALLGALALHAAAAMSLPRQARAALLYEYSTSPPPHATTAGHHRSPGEPDPC